MAHGQNINAASGQAFGNLISPKNNPSALPSNGTGGAISIPGANGTAGSTITPGDLAPSNGGSTNLSSLANSNAGITGAANTSVTNAKTDQTQWGSAYRTLHGSHLLDPHTNLTNDPMWAQTDATFQSVFANNFSGCTQSLGSPSVVVPPTKHSYSCLQTSNANLQCTVTHTLGTNVIPAAQRCDPATFVTKKLTVYDNTPATPTKVVTDNISCDANGMLQHNLASTTVTPTPSTCIKTAPTTNVCSVTHSYSATTTPGKAGKPAVGGWYCPPGWSLRNGSWCRRPYWGGKGWKVHWQRATWIITSPAVPATPAKTTVTDNGWFDTVTGSGCTATANAIQSGTKSGSFVCANDPSGGGAAWSSPGGIIKQSDMASPYTGISSLCKEMQVTENIPSVDGCIATKANPNCSFVSSTILANGDTQFTYSCNITTNASAILSNCSNGNCSANL